MEQATIYETFVASFQEAVRRNDFSQLQFPPSPSQFPFPNGLLLNATSSRGSNGADTRRYPFLHYAVACGDVKTTQFLLEHRYFNVETRDLEGNTPLIWAVRKMQPHIVSLLVKKFGANVNAQNNEGATPLFFAASSIMASEIISFLLEYGANPNIAYL
jgi:ankyrin repeat protein